MNKSLEGLKQIVEGAPSNVNHLVSFKSFEPHYMAHFEDINNLDDLRRIIKLEEENQRLRDQIKEMSELCLTNGEVDKLIANGIRKAIENVGAATMLPPDDPHPEAVAFNEALSAVGDYAKKLEGES